MLDAARELFESTGYEATTVRMIAKAAGVSVGSVFTTFASKRDVLAQILHEKFEALHLELNQLAPQLRGSTADRLRSIFAIHYAYAAQRPGLFLAYVAASFEGAVGARMDVPAGGQRLWNVLHGCLQDGRSRGEVCDHVDLSLVTDLLVSAYIWTYRLIAHDRAGPEKLSNVMDRHIGLIAEGFTPRPSSAS